MLISAKKGVHRAVIAGALGKGEKIDFTRVTLRPRNPTAERVRYLVRLHVKEFLLRNFASVPAEQLLERMVELSLYAEEKLMAGG